MRVLRRNIQRIANRLGYRIERILSEHDRARLQAIDPRFLDLYEDCREFSGLGIGRLSHLYMAAEYVIARGVPGAFVECGVGQGGVGRLLGRILVNHGESRHLYLFDTFRGMPPPGPFDEEANSPIPTPERWRQEEAKGGWINYSVNQVQPVVAASGLPAAQTHLVAGLVENTIPEHAPDQIALLHLDTDFYGSTLHELRQLFPRLSRFGVIAIDDYGTWAGVRKAVDEYVSEAGLKLLFLPHGTGRIAVNA